MGERNTRQRLLLQRGTRRCGRATDSRPKRGQEGARRIWRAARQAVGCCRPTHGCCESCDGLASCCFCCPRAMHQRFRWVLLRLASCVLRYGMALP